VSVDLGLRHDRLLREQAVEMFERGFGYRLTATRSIPPMPSGPCQASSTIS